MSNKRKIKPPKMSKKDRERMAVTVSRLDAMIREEGCTCSAPYPFMTDDGNPDENERLYFGQHDYDCGLVIAFPDRYKPPSVDHPGWMPPQLRAALGGKYQGYLDDNMGPTGIGGQ